MIPKQLLQPLAQAETAMLALTQEAASINSGSYHVAGVQKVADFYQHAFASLEASCQSIALPAMARVRQDGSWEQLPLGPLLHFTKRPEAPFQVLLVGHLDTVFAEDDAFQTVQQKDANTLHGPGVADMKGGISVMLTALQAFEQWQTKDAIGWQVILNPDEEIGSPGSAQYLKEHAGKAQVGLIYEPTVDEIGTLAGARKGSATFSFVSTGKAAHAGREFKQGRNALTGLARLLIAIDHLNDQREGVTFNIGTIHGGKAVNIVPDCCVAHLGIRFVHAEDELWIQQQLDNLVASHQMDGIEIKMHGGFSKKPKKITGNTLKLYELVKQVGAELDLAIHWQATGGCCDGNNLSEVGLPNVDTLGVRGAHIHSDREYMKIDSLVERAKLTTSLLYTLQERGL